MIVSTANIPVNIDSIINHYKNCTKKLIIGMRNQCYTIYTVTKCIKPIHYEHIVKILISGIK